MENILNVASSNTSNTSEAPRQKSRRRVSKLSASDLADFPGATIPPEKTVEPDFVYSIVLSIPVTATLGAPIEASQVHDFYYQLNLQAKAKGVGEVSSVVVTNGLFDVVLKLNVTGEQASNRTPALNAFTLLKDFLGNAVLLKKGPVGKPATYKLMVNGTTIGEGHF